MGLEFLENENDLIYETEYQLNHEPLRIDLLIIKKNRDVRIANELGAAFRGHNVLEYKSEDDRLSIDTIFKVNAYAMFYKSMGKELDSIKIDDVTVTLTRLGYPRDALAALVRQGYTVEKCSPGIYMITGKAILPTQIIVISQLNEDLHFWITKLRKSISKEQLVHVFLESKKLTQKQIELYVRPYISVLADANRKTMDKIREEDPDMGNYFKELFKEDLEKKWNEGRKEGKEESDNFTILKLLSKKKSVSEIVDLLDFPIEKVTRVAKLHGYISV